MQTLYFALLYTNRLYILHVQLERGCRQGNPMFPYLFVLSAENAGILIQINSG